MRREVVFVHIPKTGGTSVRRSLELGLKDHLILRDYQDHPLSTPDLSKLVHQEGQVADFRTRYPGDQNILLSGHFPASRYWDHFNAQSFVAFLRDPVDRLVSSYVSWVKQGRWNGPFEEYLTLPHTGRRMVSFLAGVDLKDFGFIGFLEEFDASLTALAEFVGTELPPRKRNVGDYSLIGDDTVSEKKEMARLAAQDTPDSRLYQQLRRVRSGIFRAPGAVPAIASNYSGKVWREGEAVGGWLCNTAREFIANVDIFRGDELLTSVEADCYLESAKQNGVSRSGVCGFRLGLSKCATDHGLQPGQALTFKARASSYELEGSPIPL
jgi:hypothetical protein